MPQPGFREPQQEKPAIKQESVFNYQELSGQFQLPAFAEKPWKHWGFKISRGVLGFGFVLGVLGVILACVGMAFNFNAGTVEGFATAFSTGWKCGLAAGMFGAAFVALDCLVSIARDCRVSARALEQMRVSQAKRQQEKRSKPPTP